MSDITVMILEKQLKELMGEYKEKAAAVRLARLAASLSERYLREFTDLIVRESEGAYSAKKILEDCGLSVDGGCQQTEEGKHGH